MFRRLPPSLPSPCTILCPYFPSLPATKCMQVSLFLFHHATKMEADEHKHLTLIAYLSSPCRWHFCFFSFELQSPVAVAQENPIKEILLKKWVRERVLRCSTPASYILPCLRAIISCCVCSRLCLRNSIEKSSDKAFLSTRTRHVSFFFPFLHLSSSTCSSGFIDVQCGLPQVNDDPKSRTCECRRRIR